MKFEELMAREAIRDGDKTQKRKHRSHEENLQTQCVAWFDRLFPERKQMLHHSPNESQYARERKKHSVMGTRSGFPDLIWLGSFFEENDRYIPFVGIEFKYDKGKQKPEQKEYERMFWELGAEYYVVKTKDKFMEIMVTLIEKTLLCGTIHLTKDELKSLDEAHKEVRENATSRQLIEAAKAKAGKTLGKARGTVTRKKKNSNNNV